MRNLLIVIKILILTLFVAQNPDTAVLKKVHDIQKFEKPTVDVEKKIDVTLKQNAVEIEKIRKLKESNEIEMQKVLKLEQKRKSLLQSIYSNIDKLLLKKKVPPVKEVIYVQKNDRNKIGDLTSLKMDSICVSSKRKDIFSKSKCSQWQYYTYIVDDNNNKIIIK